MIFLTRHGERVDQVNIRQEHKDYNVIDPHISDRGKRQAIDLGAKIYNYIKSDKELNDKYMNHVYK